ncbi:ABC transporter ATP-binding protein [Paraburkholderia phenoliruptrix]|uniref:ABC transporter ATP-binding protein n=1 Tax=Paraburkholderia phenoliruptrix TaxID=252970 RepID=UPI002869E824|nr:ABC transporter ATP-binding protein [Paraburkholderia phenoliruptrix]WMY10993.1 ABC transporter ATP-binding protein [Paraburkholderia phenoliruptrix]
MAVVSIAGISKAYGTTSVLRDVTLDIGKGEFLTLLGPSGCGKSTLLRILAGLETQDGGSVSIGERVVDSLRPRQRDVAMVFQSYALYPHLSVAANMALPLRMRLLSTWQRLPLIGRFLPGSKATSNDIEREVTRTAKALGIGHLLARKPGQLSGGQRQRVAVGRAMVRHPAVFLMDEPLSNLDAEMRVQMRTEIHELHQRLGATFVYVTHDQAEAMTLSDRVAVMLDGELLQVAPPQVIYNDPNNRRVAEFVGSPKINLLDGVVRGPGVIDVAGSLLGVNTNAPNGVQLTLGIRPEAFQVADRPGVGTLTGAVHMIEHMGSDLFVHVDLAGLQRPLIARLSAERASQVAVGQTLHLGVQPERVLLFAGDGQRLRTAHAPASVTPIRGATQ